MAEASTTPAPAEAASEGGIPDVAKLALLGIVAAVQAVPGFAVLSSDEWQPPDAGMFRITAAVAGAALFALVFMARRRLLRLRTRMVVTACAAAFLLALVLLYAYHAVLEDRVITFLYARQPYRWLVPFGTSRWSGGILDVIQQSNGGVPATAAGVTRFHLQNAMSEAGPAAITDAIPAKWQQLTLGTLWLMYATALGMIVVGFGIAAVRLGTGIADKRRATRTGPPAAPAEAGTTPAGADETASAEPSAVNSPQPPPVLAATEADAAPEPVGAMGFAAKGNGNGVGGPVMLKVELRAPGWVLFGAAATLAWAALRLASRRDEPRQRPPSRWTERDPRRGP
ncbi:MAG TPA: hypothetical protein VEX86_16795 [Longimicrobium sp.]|nr:hypothetical protein [Longimicrobium sp.]